MERYYPSFLVTMQQAARTKNKNKTAIFPWCVQAPVCRDRCWSTTCWATPGAVWKMERATLVPAPSLWPPVSQVCPTGGPLFSKTQKSQRFALALFLVLWRESRASNALSMTLFLFLWRKLGELNALSSPVPLTPTPPHRLYCFEKGHVNLMPCHPPYPPPHPSIFISVKKVMWI